LFIEIQLHLCSPSLWSNAYLRQISLACLHIWFSPSSALSFYNLKSMIYLIWLLIYIFLIQHIHQSFKLSVRILQWNELIVYGNHQGFVSDIQAPPPPTVPPPQGSVHYLRFGGGGGETIAGGGRFGVCFMGGGYMHYGSTVRQSATLFSSGRPASLYYATIFFFFRSSQAIFLWK
jgi:hypothetical protein